MRWGTTFSITLPRTCSFSLFSSSSSSSFCDGRWIGPSAGGGAKWQVRGIGDTAVLPLVFLVGSLFGFVTTPLFNTHTRTNEFEADMYGLNASRQPDGFAQAAIHLGEYRKMSPGPVEEW